MPLAYSFCGFDVSLSVHHNFFVVAQWSGAAGVVSPTGAETICVMGSDSGAVVTTVTLVIGDGAMAITGSAVVMGTSATAVVVDGAITVSLAATFAAGVLGVF